MLACASTIYPKWMASSHVQQGAWALLILASCFLPAWFHLKWQQVSKVINGKLNFHRLGLAGAISDIFHI
jgi:hypothetical protein